MRHLFELSEMPRPIAAQKLNGSPFDFPSQGAVRTCQPKHSARPTSEHERSDQGALKFDFEMRGQLRDLIKSWLCPVQVMVDDERLTTLPKRDQLIPKDVFSSFRMVLGHRGDFDAVIWV
jgi:hypothetical protein